MAVIFKLSDAIAIGLHAAMYLALHDGKPVTARSMACYFKVSEAHLVKVLQSLHRARLVRSTRGPHGGYQLDRPAHAIHLVELVEAIGGAIEVRQCLLHHRICEDRGCVLGPLVHNINRETIDYLRNNTVADLADNFQRNATQET